MKNLLISNSFYCIAKRDIETVSLIERDENSLNKSGLVDLIKQFNTNAKKIELILNQKFKTGQQKSK